MTIRGGPDSILLMALPLYGGPLLAGWMLAPWPVPVGLAAMFFLAQVLSGKIAARGEMPMALYLAVLALTQGVLVLAVYAAGAVLSALTGPLALPLWLPLALTALGGAVYALRFPQDPRQDEMLDLLDQALDSMENGDETKDGAEADPEVRAAARQAIEALWSLPADASAQELDKVVQRLEAKVGHRGFDDLVTEAGEGYPQVDRALLRYLARPAVLRRLISDKADLASAYALVLQSDDTRVQSEVVTLVETLLDDGTLPHALPPPDLLRDRAEEVPALAKLVAPVENAVRKGI